jgi:hypothetical protein
MESLINYTLTKNTRKGKFILTSHVLKSSLLIHPSRRQNLNNESSKPNIKIVKDLQKNTSKKDLQDIIATYSHVRKDKINYPKSCQVVEWGYQLINPE